MSDMTPVPEAYPMLVAFREIAAGHNDAQSLAQSVLESEPKP